MKTVETGGITYIEPVPGGTSEWYYGVSRAGGDLFEAEELFLKTGRCPTNDLCLVRYPGGEAFHPAPVAEGSYTDAPVFFENGIFFPTVDFVRRTIRIFRFDCAACETRLYKELPQDITADCYNLRLHTAPLTLARQGRDDRFEILWPERVSFTTGPRESFFLRDGGRLYFNRWNETGEGIGYRYWEETVVRDLSGRVLEILAGDLKLMPNGEVWFLR